MRKILAIAWNDIFMEFSERWTLVFFLVLPLVFTYVTGLGLQNMEGDRDENADPRLVVLVVDEDQSDLSRWLGESLEASEVVRPEFRQADEARLMFAEGSASAVLILPSGFGESLSDNQPVAVGLQKNAQNTQAFAVEEAVRAAVVQVGSAVAVAHQSTSLAEERRAFATLDEKRLYFSDSLAAAQERLAVPPSKVVTSQSPDVTIQVATGFEQSSPGQLVTWTLITLIGAAEVFVNERLGGTLRRLLVTPTHKALIVAGKVLGRLAMGWLQMAILIGFGAVVLGVSWGRSVAALVLVVFCFSLAAVGMGVMLGTFARTRAQASGLTIMFSMMTAALGGAWWPLEVTPPAYQAVVKILPTTWAMMGFSDVILRGQPVSGVLPEALMLVGFAVVFFVVGVWRLRFE